MTTRARLSGFANPTSDTDYCNLRLDRSAWLSRSPALLKRDGVDFYHATFTPALFSTRPLLYTVHCLSSIVHPEFYRELTARRLNFLLKRGIRQAKHIACVSRTTLEHVHEVFGIEPERMSVTYNGVGPEFGTVSHEGAKVQIRAGLGIGDPYVLYLGKIQAHKNIPRLIRAYARFRHRSGMPWKLVLAGRRQGTCDGVDEAIADSNVADDVIELGYVPAEHIAALYAGAEMFVFPSLWEGFGIPVVEAMASGTPVVTSNSTCLPEIAGDAASVVDATDVEALSEEMVRVSRDDALREQMRERGLRRAQEFTWENCARRTLEVYGRFRDA